MFDLSIKKKPKKTISMETIDFQNDSFGHELEAIFAEISEKISTKQIKSNGEIVKDGYVGKLEQIIFARLGLSVSMELNIESIGAILVMPVNDHSILLPKDFKGHDFIKEIKKQVEYKDKEKGYINLKEAKVSGLFSKYKHTLYMNIFTNIENEAMTPGELTAITLHELGHAFTWYEYSDRLESSNQVMQNVLVEMGKKEKNLTYIYRELEGNFKLSKEEIDDIVNTPSGIILGYKIYKALINEYASQLPVEKYSETSSEQLADQFANRFGYGRELVLVLDRLSKKYPQAGFLKVINAAFKFTLLYIAYVSFSIFVYITLATLNPIVGLVSGTTAALLALPAGIFLFIVAVLVGLLFLIVSKLLSASDNMTYDEGIKRYIRIRNDLISVLKTKGMKAEDKQSIINSIDTIDGIIQNSNIEISFIDSILNNIGGIFRKSEVNDIALQRMLEDLANNDIFLKSAKLSVVASN